MSREIDRNLLLFTSRFVNQKEYWLDKLAGDIGSTLLLDHYGSDKKCLTPCREKERLTMCFLDGLDSRLLRLGKGNNLSIYIILLAGLKSLIYRYTGNEDVVILSPINKVEVTNRTINNCLLIRDRVSGDVTFKELLLGIRESTLAAYENQDYPFDKLLTHLPHVRKEENHNGISHILCALGNIHDGRNIEEIQAEMGINFYFERGEDGISGTIFYDRNFYEGYFIKQASQHFIKLLQHAVEDVNVGINELSFLSAEEQERLLIDFNSSKADYPKQKTIDELFEVQVEKTPGQTALVVPDLTTRRRQQLTYGALNIKSDQVAGLLRHAGVKDGEPVALLVARTANLVIGILGILKAEAACILFDLKYPGNRSSGILKESGAKFLLKGKELECNFCFEGVTLALDVTEPYPFRAPDKKAPGRANRLAFVIYTSGSTGRPKGILVHHLGITNHVFTKIRELALGPDDVCCHNLSIAFVASIWQFFAPLFLGARLIVYPEDLIMNAYELFRRAGEDGLTLLEVVPSLLNAYLEFLETGRAKIELQQLRVLVLTGEKVTPLLVNRFYKRYSINLVNAYGQTECSDDTLHYKVPYSTDTAIVPIGRPADNTQLYVLDGNRQLQPVGAAGELYISGDGLAAGYLNRPGLTASVFVSNPFRQGERMFKTGDLARWSADGNVEYLGRVDDQIKVRGFRIEPGEIESQLVRHGSIREAVVLLKEDKTGERYLCAYMTVKKGVGAPATGELREYLAKSLPDYMIPAYFMPLEGIPLTLSGKVDKKALPEPDIKFSADYAAPRNETEKKMIEIWSEVLGVEKNSISINANFFELGGHSLKANILVTRIHKELNVVVPLREVFQASTVSGLSDYVKGARKDLYSPLKVTEKREYYPLSSSQKRLYVLQQMEGASTGYNISQVVLLEGDIEQEEFAGVFKMMIRRHESLRTSFVLVEDEPRQKIRDDGCFEIGNYDLPSGGMGQDQAPVDAVRADQKVEEIIQDFIRPFDLRQAPLLRIGMVEVEEKSHILLMDMHHIISDGTSLLVFVEEFMALFSGKELPGLRVQYKDFCQWQNSDKAQLRVREQAEYWLEEFAGEIPILNLPTDFARPTMQSFAGRSLHFAIGKGETEKLKSLTLNENATLHMMLLALHYIFFSRLTGMEDIVLGTPIGGRRHVELQNLIGMFVNTLALRNFPVGNKTFRGFLGEVKERTLKAFENQEFQFDELVDSVLVLRDTSRNPIFDVMFVLQNFELHTGEIAEREIPGLKLRPIKHETRAARFDITIFAREDRHMVFFTYEYCTKLFKVKTIERFAGYFKNIVSFILENPDSRLSAVEVINEEEKSQILFDFNHTGAALPDNKTVHRLFEEEVKKRADRPALLFKNSELTYRELNEKANQLAHMLRNRGIKGDTIVGLMVDRSFEMLIGILGILKAGGAYLPIDPGYPQERVDYILTDSHVSVCCTPELLQIDVHNSRGNGAVINPAHDSSPAHLAYVIYTSGSTGKPKGVMVEHRSVVNILSALQAHYPFGASDVYLLKTPYVFDVSVAELFGWFMGGGRLSILAEGAEKDAYGILDEIERRGITHINFVPSMFGAFVDILSVSSLSKLTGLRYIFLAGEALPPGLVVKFRSLALNIVLENIYGPTEATVYASKYSLSSWAGEGSIPIGKPLPNVKLYVMDRYHQLQGIGIAGELCIAGTGLARGYVGNEELSGEKFITNPFVKGERLYRTGDLARWLPDGHIEYLGRVDNQVKIRGQRIELAEIESRLRSLEPIMDAVVIDKTDVNGDKYLCAYLVFSKNSLPGEARSRGGQGLNIKEILLQGLPDFMIPSYYVELESIPLTASGKVDRRALPEPEVSVGRQYAAPRNEIEKIMAEVWQQVLGRDVVGIHDNFFELGGDSIKTIQVQAKMSKAGYELEMRDIFTGPTIAQLAVRAARKTREIDQSPVTGTVPLTPIQRAFFEERTGIHHFNQSVLLYSRERPDENLIRKIFKEIQRHHDALRMTFKNIEKDVDGIVQINRGIDCPLALEVYDWPGEADFQHKLIGKSNEIQSSIDLQAGPLLKLALFHLDDGDRLLIVVHHLVIDGISWRILFEEIESLYQQSKSADRFSLPLKSDSFKLWSEKLSEYVESKKLLKEREYWQAIDELSIPGINTDFNEACYQRDMAALSFRLSLERTEALLTEVNAVYNTEINDILLTGLGGGFKRTFGHDKILVSLEGHGRQDIIEGIDISRTVGWFTTVYPVLLDMSYTDDLARQIKEVKESLRRVPNKGIGYGILKYLTPDSGKRDSRQTCQPQIEFNYLGQFDQDIRQMSVFEIAQEPSGNPVSPDRKLTGNFFVSAILTDKRLTVSLRYSKRQYKYETVDRLIKNYEQELNNIIGHCVAREGRELTPADFTYKGLSIPEVDAIVGEYEVEDIYTSSPMQQGMLFHSLQNPYSSSYHEQMSYRLFGQLEPLLVERSLNELFRRHDILRTVFIYDKTDKLLQLVLKERRVDFFYKDIRDRDGVRQESFLREYRESDKGNVFSLEKDVLMRVALIRLSADEYELIWTHHHIIMDGWCINILNLEFFEIYNSLACGKNYNLAEVIPYKTYIDWLENRDRQESRTYWRNYLAGYEEKASLPTLKQSIRNINVYEHRVEDIVIDRQATLNLKKYAARHHITVSTVIQTLWGVILGKYNARNDVVFGAVVAGRPSEIEGIEAMIGLFINTIPVRIKFDRQTGFIDLLQQVQKSNIDSQPHHYISLAEIQSDTVLKYELLDHIVVYENYPITGGLEGLNRQTRTTNIHLALSGVNVYEQTNYRFNIIVSPGEKLLIKLNYNSNVYESRFMLKLGAHIENFIEKIVEDSHLSIEDMEVISAADRQKLLYEFNDTEVDTPRDKPLPQLFENQVDNSPGKTALTFSGRTMSYREVAARSNHLARFLRSRGVKPGSIAAIMVDRGFEMVIGILGILKAGGAYLPIEPDFPESRIRHMIDDSQGTLMLTQKKYETFTHRTCEKVNLDDPALFIGSEENVEIVNGANDLAYVIYTSGSTGRPKGVMVEHRSVVNLLLALNIGYPLGEAGVYLLKTSYLFDVSVAELFGWFTGGGRLAILGGGFERDPYKIFKAIKNEKVTHINFVPTMFNAFVDILASEHIDKLSPLKYIFLAGEALPPQLVQKFYRLGSGIPVENLFGPTEATVYVSQYSVPQGKEVDHVPIGTPMANTRIYILDGDRQLVPIGVVGELYLAGDGVARGYINNEELSRERFIPNPLRRGDRLYRTGDLARWLADGNIDFLGRLDQQVKVRGFRIELGEIENYLLRMERVADAVVIDRDDRGEQKYLCAYLVLNNRGHDGQDGQSDQESGELDVSAIKETLARDLPYYMIPSYFVRLHKIPLLPSGKIDRKSLPEPEIFKSRYYTAPQNDIEETLLDIFREVLGKESIGTGDNFFVLGGDSIKSIQILARLNRSGYRIELNDIFTNSTVAELATKVKRRSRDIDQSPVTGEVLLTPVQQELFNNGTDNHHFNQAVMLYAAKRLKVDPVKKIFSRIFQHHDALRMVFTGTDEGIRQQNRAPDSPLSLEEFDLTPLLNPGEALLEKANAIQSAIDLAGGPLLKLALFHCLDGDRLLIVIHHLVVDGVSWRILFEDIGNLYRQYQEGGEGFDFDFSLPPKSDSFKLWSEKLNEYSKSERLLQEKAYWKTIEKIYIPEIKQDFYEDCIQEDIVSLSFSLSREMTADLLTNVNEAYNTEIDDILLTGLGLSIKNFFDIEKVLVALEGHGRESIADDLDISRTIGWFTCIYPVLLDMSYADDMARQIKEVKENLHRVPVGGVGYGVLKYLTPADYKEDLTFIQQPRIEFNYLGQFDVDVERMGLFKIARESPGNPVSLNRRSPYIFSIIGLVSDGCLTMSISFSNRQFRSETVGGLMKSYQEELCRIISHCLHCREKEMTPSDFQYKDFTIEELAGFFD
jgi:iturin family lipopeptide synthetase B